MLFVNRHSELCLCDESDFNGFDEITPLKKMELMTVNNEKIKLWEDRIEEIKRTGNCKNGAHIQQDYFDNKYKPEEMIKFCKKMIDKLH